ncbi:MAG: hypothetical protein AAFV53_16920 [Myxococcota bacterium]
MKTGDIVRDGQGRAFQLGQPVHRGLWSKTYIAREETGSEWTLTVPLSKDDLPPGFAHLVAVCQDCLREEARARAENRTGAFLPVEAAFIAEGSRTFVLVSPRLRNSLERKLAEGCPLKELLQVCQRLSALLTRLNTSHGDLRPSNVFIDERNELLLSGMLTPTARDNLQELRQSSRRPDPYLPPELQPGQPPRRPTGGADAYAIAVMLYWGAMVTGEGMSRLPESPLNGLDKPRLVALKDRFHNRLKEEKANPRFHTRLSDRAAALLNRALSAETHPSPPYRFEDMAEFSRRLNQLYSLVHPRVTHVGKILLDRPPGDQDYSTDEDVVFSCTIGCSSGVESHEEIGCGLALFNDDTGERVRDLNASYTVDTHPSGRLRFRFRLIDLLPGSYTIRVAFTIRDSGHEPLLAEGHFFRSAAPGYTPPAVMPTAAPIPLTRPGPDPVTQPGLTPRPVPVSASAAQDEGKMPDVPDTVVRDGPPEVDRAASLAQARAAIAAARVDDAVPDNLHTLGAAAIAEERVTEAPLIFESEDQDAVAEAPTAPRIQLGGGGAASMRIGSGGVRTPSTAGGMTSRRRTVHYPDGPPTVGDEDAAASDPYLYDPPDVGRGRWSDELPPPSWRSDGDELFPTEIEDDGGPEEEFDSPFAEMFEGFLEKIRGDSVVLLFGGAAVVIMVLIVILLFMR